MSLYQTLFSAPLAHIKTKGPAMRDYDTVSMLYVLVSIALMLLKLTSGLPIGAIGNSEDYI